MTIPDPNRYVEILQISDLHVCSTTQAAVLRQLRVVADTVLDAGTPPDMLLITGDVAKSGKGSEYAQAETVLREFVALLNIDPARVTIVPGNHDVDRASIDELTEAGLGQLIKLDPERAGDLLQKYREKILSRFAAFTEFAERTGWQHRAHVQELRSWKIGIIPLNSAWRCGRGEGERGSLFLPSSSLYDLCTAMPETDIKLALAHHPLDWLHETEQTLAPGALARHVQMYFCGHRHDSDAYSRTAAFGTVVFCQARAIHAERALLGFASAKLDMLENKATIRHWRWESKRNEYAPDVSISNSGEITVLMSGTQIVPRDGQRVHALARKETASLATEVRQQIEQLAPRVASSLPTRWIPPTLLTPRGGQRIGTIDDLAASTKNWLITGNRLSGKTTLLKLLAQRIEANGHVPIYVPSRHINSPNLVHIIGHALNASNSKARALLAAAPVVLLDGIDLDGDVGVKSISGWTTEYPGVRFLVVCTRSRLHMAVSAPKEATELLADWERAEIGPVPFRQINAVAGQLRDRKVIGDTSGSNVREFVLSAFQSELPRLPWVILVFFELHARGKQVIGLTLAHLLQSYVDLQLDAEFDKSGWTPDIGKRALMLLARAVFREQMPEFPHSTFVKLLDADYNRAAINVNPELTIQGLERSGLVHVYENKIAFTFPVFLDHFYAQSILSSADAENESVARDIDDLRRRGAALALLMELAPRDARLEHTFMVAHESRILRPETLDPRLLDDLAALPMAHDQVFDKFDSDADHHENEVEERYSVGEERRTGTRRGQVAGTPTASSLQLFTEGYMSALAALRSSTFVSAEVKRKCVRMAIDMTLSVIQSLASEANLLVKDSEEILRTSSAIVNPKMRTSLSTLLFIMSNALLADHAGSAHLEKIIWDEYAHETDHCRAAILAMWLGRVARDRAVEVMLDYVKRRPAYGLLTALQVWLMVEYILTSAFEGRRDNVLREVFRVVSLEIGRQSASGKPGKEQVANQYADQMLRTVDGKIAVAAATNIGE